VHTSYALLGNRSALGSRRPGHHRRIGPPLALAVRQKRRPRQVQWEAAARPERRHGRDQEGGSRLDPQLHLCRLAGHVRSYAPYGIKDSAERLSGNNPM